MAGFATPQCFLFKQQWSYVEFNQANLNDPKGKPYGGKSLREKLSTGTWDFVTIQQYSFVSTDVKTYRPYAQKLFDFIKSIQPKSEVVMHQTWPYRSDDPRFRQVAGKPTAQTQQQMWEVSRAAYHTIAKELGIRIIPVGDAFWDVDSDPIWGYKPDTKFDFKNAVYPALPDQTYSLNAGYFWKGKKTLGMDGHHASVAGCYLTGLVWNGFLFKESPEKISMGRQKSRRTLLFICGLWLLKFCKQARSRKNRQDLKLW